MDPFRNSAPDLNRKDNGLLADFIAGGKQHRRKSSTMQRCAFGEGCRSLVISKNLGSTPLPRPSDFCQIHTCIGFQGEAPCFNRVIRTGVTRCVIHFQCTVTGCTEQRVGSANGGWWDCCLHHKCDAAECFLPRKYNILKQRHFNFCPKHKCVKDGCERSHPSWQAHCTGHTCSNSDCNGIVEGEEKLCARHMKCSHENCNGSRVRKEGGYLLFCARHNACTSPQCRRDKKFGSEFCSIHTCTISDCTKRCIGNFFYCADHICELDMCRNPRTFYMENDIDINGVKLTRYCPIHECRKPSCHLSTRNQTYGYCREHNCNIAGCNNLKMIDPESYPPLTMCRKHYDESLDPPPPPRTAPMPAPAPSPRPDTVTLSTLSAQLSKLQRTADNIAAVQRVPPYIQPGHAGGQVVGAGVLEELRKQGEEILREQAEQTHSLRLLDSIWGLLVSRGRP